MTIARTVISITVARTRYLQGGLTAGHRATDLVQQILTFSHQTEFKRSTIQLHLLINEAFRLLRAALPSTIAIRQALAHQ